MSSTNDSLIHAEPAARDKQAQILRHDLRNKLASIRNATFYLRRRLQTTAPFETDPRVPKFFALIDDELRAAEQLLQERAPVVADPGELARLVRALVVHTVEAMPPGTLALRSYEVDGAAVLEVTDAAGAMVVRVQLTCGDGAPGQVLP